MISLSKKVVEVFYFFCKTNFSRKVFANLDFSLEKFAKRKPVDFSENITHAAGNV